MAAELVMTGAGDDWRLVGTADGAGWLSSREVIYVFICVRWAAGVALRWDVVGSTPS